MVAEGLNNPHHLEIGLNGAVYVAEAGAGGDECAPSDPEDPEAETTCFGPTGAITRISDGTLFGELDVAAWEAEQIPDEGFVDSNPVSIAEALDVSGHVVSDSGANALLHVNPEGGANVYRVTPEGEVTTYAEGFTNIIDVSFDAEGNLYVLEMTAGGLGNASPDDPASIASRITKVAPDGTQEVVVDVDEGLFFATGLTVGPDGALFVSNFGVMPGMGQVVRIELAE